MTTWLIRQTKPATDKMVLYGEETQILTDIRELESRVFRFACRYGFRNSAWAEKTAEIIREEAGGCRVELIGFEL